MSDRDPLPPQGQWTVHGRIPGASNETLLVELDGRLHVYKPAGGEAPLWDFPDNTLGHREVAVPAIDEALGWGLVPPTRWAPHGPAGPGMLQLWVDHDPAAGPARLFPTGETPPGWLVVASGHAPDGHGVQLAHEDSIDLMKIAVLDAVTNNADRKGGHILRDGAGRVWAIDHGVCLHAEPKLRTVVWGFAGRPLPEPLLTDLARLARTLPFIDAVRHLTAEEVGAAAARVRDLLDTRTFPTTGTAWPSLPWPPM